MRYTDRSRTEADWVCPRSRYWQYEHDGLGIVGVEPNPDLTFGAAIALAAQMIRMEQRPAEVMLPAPYHALYAGLAEAYRSLIWPSTLQQFDVIATELECTLELAPDVLYSARPDAILRRKSDSTLWYFEDKTTSQNPEQFCKQWDKMVQLHASAVVAEGVLKEPIAGAYVQGWYKGYQKAGTFYSPLAYAWCKRAQPGLGKDVWSPTYRVGWERRAITDQGVAAWVSDLPKTLVQDQFPITPPIMIRRDLVKAYFEQVVEREQAIAEIPIDSNNMTMLFPQHFSNCDEYSKFRRACAYKDCCWAPTVRRDPVGSGLYVKREPHHAAEQIAQQKEREDNPLLRTAERNAQAQPLQKEQL